MPYRGRREGEGRENATALLPVDGAFKLFPSFGAIRSVQAEARLRDAALKDGVRKRRTRTTATATILFQGR